MIDEQMWAIIRHVRRGDDWIMNFTVRQTRKESIRQYINIFDDKAAGRRYWRRERDKGDVECVRVTITINRR